LTLAVGFRAQFSYERLAGPFFDLFHRQDRLILVIGQRHFQQRIAEIAGYLVSRPHWLARVLLVPCLEVLGGEVIVVDILAGLVQMQDGRPPCFRFALSFGFGLK
jgi:hypothetical protein